MPDTARGKLPTAKSNTDLRKTVTTKERQHIQQFLREEAESLDQMENEFKEEKNRNYLQRDKHIGIAGESSYKELIQNTVCEYLIILTNNSMNGFNSTKKTTKKWIRELKGQI